MLVVRSREVAVPERLLSHCSFNSDPSSWPFYSVWLHALWRWSLMEVPCTVLQSCLEILLLLLLLLDVPLERTSVLKKKKRIRIEKHLQCEKLLGLAGGNTKKRGNKKSGESITPIRYNIMNMYRYIVLIHHIISITIDI